MICYSFLKLAVDLYSLGLKFSIDKLMSLS